MTQEALNPWHQIPEFIGKHLLPLPGKFVKEDLYARKRWQRVQYLAEEFWSRWCKEYLANIYHQTTMVHNKEKYKGWRHHNPQWRQSPLKPVENGQGNRNSNDGLVRRAKLQISQNNSRRNTECILKWPIQKLVVLVKNNS